MSKFTIWGVLVLALSVYPVNAVAKKTPDGMTPAEETVCDQLKADGITKGLYGLCVAYCEAIDGPAEIIEGDDLSELNPPESVLLAIYQKKMKEGDPEMPCVNYIGGCPLWTQEELDRIGTLGGIGFWESEYVSPTSEIEIFFDMEVGSGFSHYAQLMIDSYGNIYGRYFSSGTGFPSAFRFMYLTEAEYDSCKQMLIDHETQPPQL